MAKQVVRFQAKDGTTHETPELADDHDHFENFRREASELFCLPPSKAWEALGARQGSALQPPQQTALAQFQQAPPYYNTNISLRQIWCFRKRLLPLLAQGIEADAP